MEQRHFASARIATDRQRVSPALLTQKNRFLALLASLAVFSLSNLGCRAKPALGISWFSLYHLRKLELFTVAVQRLESTLDTLRSYDNPMDKKEFSSSKNALSERRVVIIDTGYASYEYERKVLEDASYVLDIFQGKRHDRQGKMAFAKNAIGLLCRWTSIDAEFLDAAPTLKAVVRYGVGYDTIDLPAAMTRGVRVANVQGYANHSVSDHALALMFACVRALPLRQKVFKTQFSTPPRERLFEFHDKTLGIIGLGRIGGTLCKKTQTLFKRVLACDPYIPEARFIELGAVKTDLGTVLAESHVISLHCNRTEETTQLIDRTAFSQMQQRPILINTARGEVVDEEALLEALESDQLHSAGLDVFCDEPPLANCDELLAHPHLIATGHYAWYSETALIELQKGAAENMLMLLQGNLPEDCLNP